MIKKIIFSFFIGAIFTLFVMQQDPWLCNKVGQFCCEHVGNFLNSDISFTHNSLNFFSPKMTFYNVKTQPIDDNDWVWECDEYTTGFSWWNVLIYGTVDMWVVIKGLRAQSKLHGDRLAIKPHIETLLQSTQGPIPVYLKTCMFDNASLKIFDTVRGITSRLAWSSESQKIKKLFKTRVYLKSGDLSIADKSYCEHINGLVQMDAYSTQDGTHVSVHTDNIYFNLPQLPQENKTCFISGAWSKNIGRFMICNAEQSFIVDPIFLKKNNDTVTMHVEGQLPLAYLQNIYGDIDQLPITGTGLFVCKGSTEAMHGSIKVIDVVLYNRLICPLGTCTFSHNKHKWSGAISLNMSHIHTIKGKWIFFTDKKEGGLSLHNTQSIMVPHAPYWQLSPKSGLIKVALDSSGKITGTYDLQTHNTVLNTSVASAGSVIIDGADVCATCTLHDYQLDIRADLNSKTKLQKCICLNQKNKKSVDVHALDTKTLSGFVDYSFVRGVLKNLWGYDAQGEGVMRVSSTIDNGKLKTQLSLTNGNIRLPQTYNFIDKFNAECIYDMRNQMFTIKDMYCGLHTGTLYSPRVVVWLNNNKQIDFAHAPFMFDRCLLNVKKDLFAIVSGCVLLKKERAKTPLLSGCVTIDRAQLKENIFSQDFQKNMFGYTGSVVKPMFTMLCDLTVQTKSPIRVDTSFLQTSADVDLAFTDNIVQPQIAGSITLSSGTLNFPYKPLMINKGALYFLANQSYDPMVELIAKNKVKKYNVGLHVSGSLYNHHILLDSTPPLSEEQIVSLLLVGSHEESLNMVMPALIMQNVRHLIFGSNQSSILEKFFVGKHRSFNINLIPSFSDQTGRGGLRGTLEIDVNDRWRAMLQKNFSLSEDTRFELEYLLSDDITIRGIRNERRDISTEVEMRWKF